MSLPCGNLQFLFTCNMKKSRSRNYKCFADFRACQRLSNAKGSAIMDSEGVSATMSSALPAVWALSFFGVSTATIFRNRAQPQIPTPLSAKKTRSHTWHISNDNDASLNRYEDIL